MRKDWGMARHAGLLTLLLVILVGIGSPAAAQDKPAPEKTPAAKPAGDDKTGESGSPTDGSGEGQGDGAKAGPAKSDKTAGDKTAGDKTAGDKTAGDKTPGDKTPGDKTSGGDKPAEAGKPITLEAGKRTARSLMPLAKGRELVYELTLERVSAVDNAGAGEPSSTPRAQRLIMRRLADETIDDKTYIVVGHYVEQQLRQREYFLHTAEGLVCVLRVFGPKDHATVYRLKEPLKVVDKANAEGATWTWEGLVGKSEGRMTMTVGAAVELELGKTRRACVPVTAEFKGKDDSTGTLCRWFSPGVGIVKETMEVRTPQEIFRSTSVLVEERAAGGDDKGSDKDACEKAPK